MEKGERVYAIESTDRATNTARVYGAGEFQGYLDHEIQPGLTLPNPCIKLDNGHTVWGCECWWGSEQAILKRLGKMKIITVPTPEEQREKEKTSGDDARG